MILNEYVGIKLEIADLEKRIEGLRENGTVILGKVKASNRDFPYNETSFTVSGSDIKSSKEDEKRKLEFLLSERLVKLKEIERKVEEYIQSVRNPVDRVILRKRFFDGLSQEDIAEIVGYERSNIAKRIKKYLKE